MITMILVILCSGVSGRESNGSWSVFPDTDFVETKSPFQFPSAISNPTEKNVNGKEYFISNTSHVGEDIVHIPEPFEPISIMPSVENGALNLPNVDTMPKKTTLMQEINPTSTDDGDVSNFVSEKENKNFQPYQSTVSQPSDRHLTSKVDFPHTLERPGFHTNSKGLNANTFPESMTSSKTVTQPVEKSETVTCHQRDTETGDQQQLLTNNVNDIWYSTEGDVQLYIDPNNSKPTESSTLETGALTSTMQDLSNVNPVVAQTETIFENITIRNNLSNVTELLSNDEPLEWNKRYSQSELGADLEVLSTVSNSYKQIKSTPETDNYTTTFTGIPTKTSSELLTTEGKFSSSHPIDINATTMPSSKSENENLLSQSVGDIDRSSIEEALNTDIDIITTEVALSTPLIPQIFFLESSTLDSLIEVIYERETNQGITITPTKLNSAETKLANLSLKYGQNDAKTIIERIASTKSGESGWQSTVDISQYSLAAIVSTKVEVPPVPVKSEALETLVNREIQTNNLIEPLYNQSTMRSLVHESGTTNKPLSMIGNDFLEHYSSLEDDFDFSKIGAMSTTDEFFEVEQLANVTNDQNHETSFESFYTHTNEENKSIQSNLSNNLNKSEMRQNYLSTKDENIVESYTLIEDKSPNENVIGTVIEIPLTKPTTPYQLISDTREPNDNTTIYSNVSTQTLPKILNSGINFKNIRHDVNMTKIYNISGAKYSYNPTNVEMKYAEEAIVVQSEQSDEKNFSNYSNSDLTTQTILSPSNLSVAGEYGVLFSSTKVNSYPNYETVTPKQLIFDEQESYHTSVITENQTEASAKPFTTIGHLDIYTYDAESQSHFITENKNLVLNLSFVDKQSLNETTGSATTEMVATTEDLVKMPTTQKLIHTPSTDVRAEPFYEHETAENNTIRYFYYAKNLQAHSLVEQDSNNELASTELEIPQKQVDVSNEFLFTNDVPSTRIPFYENVTTQPQLIAEHKYLLHSSQHSEHYFKEESFGSTTEISTMGVEQLIPLMQELNYVIPDIESITTTSTEIPNELKVLNMHSYDIEKVTTTLLEKKENFNVSPAIKNKEHPGGTGVSTSTEVSSRESEQQSFLSPDLNYSTLLNSFDTILPVTPKELVNTKGIFENMNENEQLFKEEINESYITVVPEQDKSLNIHGNKSFYSFDIPVTTVSALQNPTNDFANSTHINNEIFSESTTDFFQIQKVPKEAHTMSPEEIVNGSMRFVSFPDLMTSYHSISKLKGPSQPVSVHEHLNVTESFPKAIGFPIKNDDDTTNIPETFSSNEFTAQDNEFRNDTTDVKKMYNLVPTREIQLDATSFLSYFFNESEVTEYPKSFRFMEPSSTVSTYLGSDPDTSQNNIESYTKLANANKETVLKNLNVFSSTTDKEILNEHFTSSLEQVTIKPLKDFSENIYTDVNVASSSRNVAETKNMVYIVSTESVPEILLTSISTINDSNISTFYVSPSVQHGESASSKQGSAVLSLGVTENLPKISTARMVSADNTERIAILPQASTEPIAQADNLLVNVVAHDFPATVLELPDAFLRLITAVSLKTSLESKNFQTNSSKTFANVASTQIPSPTTVSGSSSDQMKYSPAENVEGQIITGRNLTFYEEVTLTSKLYENIDKNMHEFDLSDNVSKNVSKYSNNGKFKFPELVNNSVGIFALTPSEDVEKFKTSLKHYLNNTSNTIFQPSQMVIKNHLTTSFKNNNLVPIESETERTSKKEEENIFYNANDSNHPYISTPNNINVTHSFSNLKHNHINSFPSLKPFDIANKWGNKTLFFSKPTSAVNSKHPELIIFKEGNQTSPKVFLGQNEKQEITIGSEPVVLTASRPVSMHQPLNVLTDVVPKRNDNGSIKKFLNTFTITKFNPLSNDSLFYDSNLRHNNDDNEHRNGQQQINLSTATHLRKLPYYRINSKTMASIKLFNDMFSLTTTKPFSRQAKYANSQKNVNKNKDLDIVASRIRTIAHEFCDGRDIAKFLPLLNVNGSFSDINYVNDLQAIRIHGRRIGAVAVKELENNGSLSPLTVASFDYITYYAPPISSTNWWWHVIGVPSSIWQAMFIAHKHLSAITVDRFMDRYFKDTYSGSVWNPSQNAEMMAGGNFAPRAVMALVEGYVRGSFEKFYAEIKNIFHKEVVDKDPWEGNGFRHDGCLHQHNLRFQRKTKDGITQKILSHIYNNNYGKEFLKNAALLIWLVDGTAYDFGNRIEEAVFSSFFDCEVWLYRYKTVEPTSTGRFIDSGRIVTRVGGLDAVERTLKIFEKIGRKKEAVQSALHRYYNAFPEKKFALEGNRYFFSSDLMAHQRRNYMATLRLLSSRSSRPESKPNIVNGENSKGYYQGDGFLTVLVTGKEYGSFNREVFQVYDWARVPGTTCLYTKAVPQIPTAPYFVKHAYNDADFVGGVSNGKLGVASMIYARPTVALRSKKTWFFFEDLLVCLGSDILLPQEFVTGHQVSTILTQVEYNGSYIIGNQFWVKSFGVEKGNNSLWWDTYSTTEVTWMYHNFIGYVPLDGNGQINIHVAKKYIKKDPITIFSSWLDHSSSPVSSKYSYAILPSWSPNDVADFAFRPKVNILNQTGDQHAVCYSSNVLGGVLFHAGCLSLNACFNSFIEDICLDQPGMILISIIDYKNGFDNLCPNGVFPAFQANNAKAHENFVQSRYMESLKKKRIHKFRESYTNLSNSSLSSQVDENLKSLNSDPSSQIVRNDVIYEYVKNPTPQSKTLMKVSLSDPTQKLKYLNLKVRSKLLVNDFVVKLPEVPRLGDSAHLCILEPLH